MNKSLVSALIVFGLVMFVVGLLLLSYASYSYVISDTTYYSLAAGNAVPIGAISSTQQFYGFIEGLTFVLFGSLFSGSVVLFRNKL